MEAYFGIRINSFSSLVMGAKYFSEYEVHRGSIFDCCWLSCERRIVTGSADKTIRMTDAATGEVVQQFGGHDSTVRSVQPHPTDPSPFYHMINIFFVCVKIGFIKSLLVAESVARSWQF